MNPLNLLFKVITLVLLMLAGLGAVSCNSYSPIRVHQRSRNVLPALSTPGTQYSRRYFAPVDELSLFSSPLSEINNQAITLALEGQFAQAERLLKEILNEEKNSGAVYNNLGIIYEVFNRHDKAFSMYSTACLLNPDNQYYRKNFLFFIDKNGSGKKSTIVKKEAEEKAEEAKKDAEHEVDEVEEIKKIEKIKETPDEK
ncbi:MAG: tetratricopeptide repeat protein [bacterium]|nr:tetratricopeptide repeat protein [bacterium]